MAVKKADKNKMPTAEELRALSVDELQKKLAERREELMRARFKHATAALEDTALLPALRREIARIFTVMKEKEKVN